MGMTNKCEKVLYFTSSLRRENTNTNTKSNNNVIFTPIRLAKIKLTICHP